MKKSTFVSLLLSSVLGVSSSPVLAAEGGYTNYIPGLYGDFGVAIAPPPGTYFRSDFYNYQADKSNERVVRAGSIRSDLDLEVTMLMLTGLKVTDKVVWGGQYAFGIFVPITSTELSGEVSLGPLNTSFDEDVSGLADIGVMPISLYWNDGNWHYNAYHTITMPTGSYDKNDALNPSLNYWSFDTNLAVTHLDENSGREFSATIGYIFNTENDDTDYQTGEELHIDYMLNQFLSETTAIGIHGFFYEQVTGDSGDGALLGSNKGEASGIGPAFTWTSVVGERPLIFSAKWLHELDAENRLEGDHIFFSLTMPL